MKMILRRGTAENHDFAEENARLQGRCPQNTVLQIRDTAGPAMFSAKATHQATRLTALGWVADNTPRGQKDDTADSISLRCRFTPAAARRLRTLAQHRPEKKTISLRQPRRRHHLTPLAILRFHNKGNRHAPSFTTVSSSSDRAESAAGLSPLAVRCRSLEHPALFLPAALRHAPPDKTPAPHLDSSRIPGLRRH